MSNALVPLLPADRDSRGARSAGRTSADFIAQLIATSGHAPQTRSRCRAAPDEASAHYRAQNQAPLLLGRTLCRSL
jgi:hypothetical protein